MSTPTAVRPEAAEPQAPGANPLGSSTPRSLTVPGILMPALAVWAAVLMSALSLAPLFVESGWFGATMLTVSAVVAVGGLATWLRAPMVLVPILCAVALFAALTLRFVEDAPWGFLPTPYALGQLRDVLAQGTADIDRFAPPVPYSEGLAAVTALGVGSVALVVLVLQVVLRMPALAGLPLVAMYVVPSTVLSGGAPWWAFVLVVTGWLLLLVSDERLTLVSWGRLLRRSDRVGGVSPLSGLSSSAFRLGAAAVALALVLPVVIPGLADAVIGRSISGSGGGDGEGSGADDPQSIGIDPLVSLQRNLLNQPAATVLRYTTTDPSPDYLRAVVLEDFDGDSWKPRAFNPASGSAPLSGGVTTAGALPAGVKSTPYSYQIAADRLESRYLPLPLTSLAVGLDGNWFVDQATTTVFSGDDATTTKGATWRVDAVDLQPDPAQLRAAPALSGLDRQAVISSIEVPEALAQQAREVTQGTTSDFDAAKALEKWFTTEFTYSTQGVRPDSSTTYLEQFLRDRTGYCEQFSATMALMASSLGIKSRVAVGFTPGTRVQGEDGVWQVTGKNAHAWPELFFSGIGWVRFEPTPSTPGSSITPPPYTGAGSDLPTSPPSAGAGRPGGNPRDRDLASSADDKPLAVDLPTSAAAGSGDAWRLRAFVALLLLVVLAALVPATRRVLVRRRRLAPDAGVEAAWSELRDTAVDIGAPWSDSRTPRQAVAALVVDQRLSGAPADAAVRLGRAVEQARYAPTPPDLTLLRDDIHTVRSAMLGRLDRSTRLRALLVPASLRWSRDALPASG